MRSLKTRREKLEVDIQRRRQRHEGLLAQATAFSEEIESALASYLNRIEALR